MSEDSKSAKLQAEMDQRRRDLMAAQLRRDAERAKAAVRDSK